MGALARQLAVHADAKAALVTEANVDEGQIAWPGGKFDAGGPKQTWARVTVISPAGSTSQGDLGTSFRRTVGQVAIQLFAPLRAGLEDIMTKADQVATHFYGRRSGIMQYLAPTVEPVGPDATHYGVTVWVPFIADEMN